MISWPSLDAIFMHRKTDAALRWPAAGHQQYTHKYSLGKLAVKPTHDSRRMAESFRQL